MSVIKSGPVATIWGASNRANFKKNNTDSSEVGNSLVFFKAKDNMLSQTSPDPLFPKQKKKRAFIIFHGFRNSFESALVGAIELSDPADEYDTFLLSWPSFNDVDNYSGDHKNAVASVPLAKEFLATIAQEYSDINLLVHSHGAVILMNILLGYTLSFQFNNIIWAAADIAETDFWNNRIFDRTQHTFVFYCPYDMALEVSKEYNQSGVRLGGVDKLIVPDAFKSYDIRSIKFIARTKMQIHHSYIYKPQGKTMIHQIMQNKPVDAYGYYSPSGNPHYIYAIRKWVGWWSSSKTEFYFLRDRDDLQVLLSVKPTSANAVAVSVDPSEKDQIFPSLGGYFGSSAATELLKEAHAQMDKAQLLDQKSNEEYLKIKVQQEQVMDIKKELSPHMRKELIQIPETQPRRTPSSSKYEEIIPTPRISQNKPIQTLEVTAPKKILEEPAHKKNLEEAAHKKALEVAAPKKFLEEPAQNKNQQSPLEAVQTLQEQKTLKAQSQVPQKRSKETNVRKKQKPPSTPPFFSSYFGWF